jgi:hypothetical protein
MTKTTANIVNSDYIFVIADTINGIELYEDAEVSLADFVTAETFISWLSSLAEGETIWTMLTREQAEAINEEYGIHGFNA